MLNNVKLETQDYYYSGYYSSYYSDTDADAGDEATGQSSHSLVHRHDAQQLFWSALPTSGARSTPFFFHSSHQATKQMKVPLLDLHGQYQGLREELLAAVTRVMDSQRFVLGEDARWKLKLPTTATRFCRIAGGDRLLEFLSHQESWRRR